MYKPKFIREIGLGISNLMHHKLRSLLTMLGMVFGVGSVIAMLAVGEGASEEMKEQIRKLGSNNIIIRSKKPIDEESQQTSRTRMIIYGLLYEDEERIATGYENVKQTVPVKMSRQQGRLGEKNLDLRLMGTTPAWFELVQRPVIAGRRLEWSDIQHKRNVVVLTEYGARRLLANANTIGQPIRIGSAICEVVGIVQSEQTEGGASIQTPDRNIDAYAPLSLIRERIGDIIYERTTGSRSMEMVELHQIIVQVDTDENVQPVASAIEYMLKRFHKKKDYEISVPLALLRQAEATKRTFNIVMGSIAGISLLVGGIGIMNIMLASVTERTREIGIRRAIGAKRRQIITQFLIETVVLSTVGGLIGMGIGLGIPWAIEKWAKMPTVVTSFSLVLALGISMIVGIIFGLYPAVRASKLDPIEALRHE